MSNESFDKGSRRSRRKIALFAIGMAIVVGVVAYSLIARDSNPAGGAACNQTPAVTGISELNWAQTVVAKFANYDFVFVILPGTDNATQEIAPSVASAAATIQAQGVRTDILTLNSSDPEVSITAERLAITQLPAVLALSNSGNGVILTKEITETKLLQAFLTALQACAPGAGSGCCPK